MNNKTAVYIGLGSNMENPEAQIDTAIRKIVNCDDFAMVLSSSYYKSAPVGYKDQDDFINCVVRADTSLSPEELLTFLQNIENEAGRQRDPDNQNAPRPIDCDILLYGSEQIDSESLTVPHPRMTVRMFVMQPLAELSKTLEIPAIGPAQEVLEELTNNPVGQEQKVEKL